MIVTFEPETFELTEQEQEIYVPAIIRVLQDSTAKRVTSPVLEREIKRLGKLTTRPNGATVRKCIHYIRVNSLALVLGDHEGYFISDHPDEIGKCIESLEQRARSIWCAAHGLRRQYRDSSSLDLFAGGQP